MCVSALHFLEYSLVQRYQEQLLLMHRHLKRYSVKTKSVERLQVSRRCFDGCQGDVFCRIESYSYSGGAHLFCGAGEGIVGFFSVYVMLRPRGELEMVYSVLGENFGV